MTQLETTTAPTPSAEDFAALLDETFRQSERIEGSVVTGTVIAIDNDEAVVDVGLKAEGRVPLKEFSTPGHHAEVQVGDRVEVYVERFENKNGEALLSRDKAAKPDAVFAMSYPSDSVLYVRQAKELGIDAKFQWMAIGPAIPFFRKMFGGSANGIVTMGHWSPAQTRWPPLARQRSSRRSSVDAALAGVEPVAFTSIAAGAAEVQRWSRSGEYSSRSIAPCAASTSRAISPPRK